MYSGIFRNIFSQTRYSGSIPASSVGVRDKDGWPRRYFGAGSFDRNSDVSPESAMLLTAVFACIRNISESFAMLPKKIFDNTDPEAPTIVRQHPSSKIFSFQANDWMTSMTFFSTIIGHSLGWGNGYAELEFAKGTRQVIRLWPIPPDKIEPKFVEKGNQIISYYEVRLPDGTIKNIRAENILHIKAFSDDGIKGCSLIKMGCRAIGLGHQLEEFATRFFEQGSLGGGYITLPTDQTPEQTANLLTSLEDHNTGLAQSHRFKFLFDGLTLTPNPIKPDEAQFLESRQEQAKEIARLFRMPLHKIQEIDKASYNSMEQMSIEFVQDTLMPIVANVEQEVKRKIFGDTKDENLSIKINVSALLRGDTKTRGEYYRTMIFIGAMTQNEVRRLEDLPVMPDADKLFIPTNLIPSDKEMDGKERVVD